MKNLLIRIVQLMLVLLLVPGMLYAQQQVSPAIHMQKCFGGSQDDNGRSFIRTFDGGYIFAGGTHSRDGDVVGMHGSGTRSDVWVVKLGSTGMLQWQTCLGGTQLDWASDIIQTSDGGYALAGYTNSNDGDVVGNHGEGKSDAWVVKLSSTGTIQWQKCLGGSEDDVANCILQNPDGGYTVAGYANSANGDVFGNHGNADAWVVTLSDTGDILRQKCLGGSNADMVKSIIRTSGGGFVLSAVTTSNNGDVSGNHGNFDVWIVELNSSDSILWQRCYGGSQNDYGVTCIKTIDGGFAVSGYTESSDGDVLGGHGSEDAWILKIGIGGTLEWQLCIGGTKVDRAFSLIQTPDSGYVVVGSSYSSDGDMPGNQGGADVLVVKLGPSGTREWQKSMGGFEDEHGYSIIPTQNGSYALLGSTSSFNNGDVTGNHGAVDTWLTGLGGTLALPKTTATAGNGLSLVTYPNPAVSSVTVGYDLPHPSHITTTITNSIGENIKVIHETYARSGPNEMFLDLGGYAEGAYFITVTSDGVSETSAIQVTR